MTAITEFLGRLHPVLVHLPIGFLLLGLILQWISFKEKYQAIIPAVKIAYLLGALGAVASCCSGWLLSSGGEYDEATLQWHKWFGISVAAVSLTGYFFVTHEHSLTKKGIAVTILLLLFITGHLGGTLTHGEGFLTKGILDHKADSAHMARKALPNVQEAVVFSDIIQPVLIDKCGSCHSATKQKGGLRLDAKDWIIKGGKDGKVFETGNAEASALYKRIVMDPLEEKHMPPKGKPQLTEQETTLLHWWISSGAGFDKKVKEVQQPSQLQAALLALQSAPVSVKKAAIPDETVEKAPAAVLEDLRKEGVIVLPVSANSNYLMANYVSMTKVTDRSVVLLKKISRQLVWLKLNDAELNENTWKLIGECKMLTRLSIEHSNITDAGLQNISHLSNLVYLNLVGTKVSANGIQQLKTLSKLEELYLGQTMVKGNDFVSLQKIFPKVQVDSGNYQVASLATDTQLVKAPPPPKK